MGLYLIGKMVLVAAFTGQASNTFAPVNRNTAKQLHYRYKQETIPNYGVIQIGSFTRKMTPRFGDTWFKRYDAVSEWVRPGSVVKMTKWPQETLQGSVVTMTITPHEIIPEEEEDPVGCE